MCEVGRDGPRGDWRRRFQRSWWLKKRESPGLFRPNTVEARSRSAGPPGSAEIPLLNPNTYNRKKKKKRGREICWKKVEMLK
jgi:hypothetical protein